MKKLPLLLVLLIISISCSQKDPEEKIQENLKVYIQENAKDPGSYEPLETELVDTVSLGELARLKLEEIKNDIAETDSKIDDAKYKIKENELKLENPPSESLKDLYSQMIDNQNKVIKLHRASLNSNNEYREKLETLTTSDSIMYYTFIHKCRLKNGFGALDLSNYVVTADTEMNIQNVTDNPKEAISFTLSQFDKAHSEARK